MQQKTQQSFSVCLFAFSYCKTNTSCVFSFCGQTRLFNKTLSALHAVSPSSRHHSRLATEQRLFQSLNYLHYWTDERICEPRWRGLTWKDVAEFWSSLRFAGCRGFELKASWLFAPVPRQPPQLLVVRHRYAVHRGHVFVTGPRTVSLARKSRRMKQHGELLQTPWKLSARWGPGPDGSSDCGAAVKSTIFLYLGQAQWESAWVQEGKVHDMGAIAARLSNQPKVSKH